MTRKIILIYTENYAFGGGGNKYLIDILNSIDSKYDIILCSNTGGVFNEELNLIKCKFTYKQISVITRPNYFEVKGLERKVRVLLSKMFNRKLDWLLSYYNRHILISVLKKENPDLVISCNGGYPGGKTCLDIIFACKNQKIPNVLSVVSMPTYEHGTEIDRVYKSINNSLNTLIVNSKSIKSDFVNRLKFDENKITVLYNKVDIQQPIDVCDLKRDYSIELNGKKVIGYIGRIEVSKGIFVLLDSFKLVINQNKNVFLLIAGSGDDLDKARNYAKQIDIDGNILFTGFYTGKVIELLELIDIFVFPSFWEGLPFSILEAMAAGKIIVSTNVGGIPEIIENGKDGFLVQPNDSVAISERVLEILGNYENFTKVGNNAKSRIIKEFSTTSFTKSVNRIIENLIN